MPFDASTNGCWSLACNAVILQAQALPLQRVSAEDLTMLRTAVSGIRCANLDCAGHSPAMASCVVIVIDPRTHPGRMERGLVAA